MYYFENNKVELNNLTDDTWFIGSRAEIALKQKIEEIGTPLKDWDVNIYRGVLTGYNNAFIIDETKRAELIAQDPKSEEIIKPVLRGRDIKRYGYDFAGLYLIDSHNGYRDETGNRISPIVIDEYPTIKRHLDMYWEKISVRQDKGVTPYNLRNCAYYPEFAKEKVVYSEIVREPQFFLDRDGKFFAEATNFILTGEELETIVAVLHSKIFTYAFQNYYAGGGLGETGYRYKKAFLENVPIPPITATNRHLAEQIEKLVELRIVETHCTVETNGRSSQITDTEIESEIDQLVYELYGLTEKEVQIVEESM